MMKADPDVACARAPCAGGSAAGVGPVSPCAVRPKVSILVTGPRAGLWSPARKRGPAVPFAVKLPPVELAGAEGADRPGRVPGVCTTLYPVILVCVRVPVGCVAFC